MKVSLPNPCQRDPDMTNTGVDNDPLAMQLKNKTSIRMVCLKFLESRYDRDLPRDHRSLIGNTFRGKQLALDRLSWIMMGAGYVACFSVRGLNQSPGFLAVPSRRKFPETVPDCSDVEVK